jgi:hypothetical protein
MKPVFNFVIILYVLSAGFTACRGPVGPQGEPGTSPVWKGEGSSAPAAPEAGWACYNTTVSVSGSFYKLKTITPSDIGLGSITPPLAMGFGSP